VPAIYVLVARTHSVEETERAREIAVPGFGQAPANG